MSQMCIEAKRVIHARPEAVYAVLADYTAGHLAILPKPYFQELKVVEGGVGAGTVFDVTLKVLGIVRKFHMTVSEPEPGQVMVEYDADAGTTTTFTVKSLANGHRTEVTMSSDVRLSPGVMGIVERVLNPLLLGRMLRAELMQLELHMVSESMAA